MRKRLIILFAAFALAGCGSAGVSNTTNSDGSVHWSNAFAQSWMKHCQDGGSSLDTCLCEADYLQAAGVSENSNLSGQDASNAADNCK